jgi:hypothetical protein
MWWIDPFLFHSSTAAPAQTTGENMENFPWGCIVSGQIFKPAISTLRSRCANLPITVSNVILLQFWDRLIILTRLYGQIITRSSHICPFYVPAGVETRMHLVAESNDLPSLDSHDKIHSTVTNQQISYAGGTDVPFDQLLCSTCSTMVRAATRNTDYTTLWCIDV